MPAPQNLLGSAGRRFVEEKGSAPNSGLLMEGVGGILLLPPELLGASLRPPPRRVFASERPRAELATPRIGCSVTTRKPRPGRSEPPADGGTSAPRPSPHPKGEHPGVPEPPPRVPDGRPRATFYCFTAGVGFGADFFCGQMLPALFLSNGAGGGGEKRKRCPARCVKGIRNSAWISRNLPVPTKIFQFPPVYRVVEPSGVFPA